MSFDSYIDNLIGHSSNACDKACIIGLDGAACTTDSHPKALVLSSSERSAIAAAMRSADIASAFGGRIVAGGTSYQLLRVDGPVALGKLKDFGAITLQMTKTLVVIGHTKEGYSQGNTNKAVGVIADYLTSLGQ